MKELVPLLEKLAESLGTSTEMLWGALLKQAPISAMSEVVIMIFTVIGLVVFTRLLLKNGRQWFEDGEMGRLVTASTGMFICVLIAFVELTCLATTIAGFINPEYWALKKVMSLMGR